MFYTSTVYSDTPWNCKILVTGGEIIMGWAQQQLVGSVTSGKVCQYRTLLCSNPYEVEWSCCLEAPYYNIPGPTHYGTGAKCPLWYITSDKKAPDGIPVCGTRIATRYGSHVIRWVFKEYQNTSLSILSFFWFSPALNALILKRCFNLWSKDYMIIWDCLLNASLCGEIKLDGACGITSVCPGRKCMEMLTRH